MKLGIYGGTFSPIHNGHILAAREFLNEMQLDKLLIIPTALPPHKAEVVGASEKERLEMAKLAFEDFPDVEVSDFEIKRGGKSYSVNTLEHFKEGNELYMLVGTDMFLTLDEWFRPNDIFKLSNIVLKRRENDADTEKRISEKSREYELKFGARIYFIKSSPFEVSSTDIREKIRSGNSICEAVPQNVAEYIYNHNLYKGGIQ